MAATGVDWPRGFARLGILGLRLRLGLLGVAVLCYLLLLEASVLNGFTGRAWWGISVAPGPGGRPAVAWLEPNGLAWSLGLEAGDVLVEVDGGPPPTDLEKLNAARELRVESADDHRSLILRHPDASGSGGLAPYSTAAVSAFFVLAGALVYLRATTRLQARAFAALCAGAALTLVTVPAGALGTPWAVRLAFVSAALEPLAFASFFLVFPINRTRRGNPARAVLPALFLLPTITLALYVATLVGHFRLFEWAERIGYVNMVVGYGSGLGLLIHSYVSDCAPRTKQRLRIAVGGAILGTLPFLGLSVIPKSLATGQQMAMSGEGYIVPPELTVLATVLIPLSFGYAVIKHQLIQTDVVIRRTVIYAMVTLATTVVYLLTVSISQAIYGAATGHSSTITLVASALIVALAAEPLRRATERWVERVFFSDIYAYRQLLSTSELFLNTILSPNELIPLILGTVTAALPVSRLGLFVAGGDGASYRLRWDQGGQRSGEAILGRHHPAVREVEARSRAIILDSARYPSLAGAGAGQPAPADGSQAGRQTSVEPSVEIEALEVRVLAPLKAGGEVIAILALGDRSDGEPYSGADLEFLDSAATRYAVALDNALLHETVRQQADTDALTGVYNHRYLLERLSLETATLGEERRPLAVLMMDVDSFKFYNDTYGHPAGDKVLIAVSQVLRAVVRPGDVFGRYGGDEFVAILPNTDRQGALAMADLISAAAQKSVFQADGSEPISLSVTIGVAVMPGDGDTPLQLISAADVNMYGRKRAALLAASTLPDVSDVSSPALRALLIALQQKDGFVAAHSERTAHWAVRIAVALGLSEREQRIQRIAGLLHDVGKLGVPEGILNKAEPLTALDRQVVEQHVELGVRLINDVPYLEEVIEAVAHHHERWDGLGYPNGLRGEEIPLRGRVLAAADVYSAMTTDRPYRSRLTREEAADRIRRQAGAQLDPAMVQALLTIIGTGDGIHVSSDGARAAESPVTA